MGDPRGISPMSGRGNLAENWKIWRSRFQNFMVATEMSKKDEKIQCAQLLHYIGEEGFRIYTTFEFAEDEINKIEILLNKFETHFLPKQKLSFERYKFFTYRQGPEQKFESFIFNLKKQASKCNFGVLNDELIKCMCMIGVLNNEIRVKLFQNEEMKLEDTINLCKVLEKSKEQSILVAAGTNNVKLDAVSWRKKGEEHFKLIKNCSRCTQTHRLNNCPAYGKTCSICKIKNHFANACRMKNKKVHSDEA